PVLRHFERRTSDCQWPSWGSGAKPPVISHDRLRSISAPPADQIGRRRLPCAGACLAAQFNFLSSFFASSAASIPEKRSSTDFADFHCSASARSARRGKLIRTSRGLPCQDRWSIFRKDGAS